VNYTFITGSDLNRLPLYTERVDRIKDTSQITYSLTNRILARTASGPDAEPVRWEAVRLVLGHSIDLRQQNNALGDVIGDLIVQAPSIFRFRAEGTYNLATSDIVTATTDLSATVSGVTGAVGTRYDAQQRTNFLQATLRAEITERLVVQGSTNWDLRTDTFVENQFGIDLRFQCYEFSVVFIDRSRELRRNGADQEVRFSVNLLGVGGPIRTTVGP
jgi:lipopolysaccharide assembly outer membrane protein LptD (OstA)